jgi:hypothetical protein
MDVQETYASSINQRYISTQDLSRTCTQMYLPNQETVAHKYMYVFRILSLPSRLLRLYTRSQHTLYLWLVYVHTIRHRPSRSSATRSLRPSVRSFRHPPQSHNHTHTSNTVNGASSSSWPVVVRVEEGYVVLDAGCGRMHVIFPCTCPLVAFVKATHSNSRLNIVGGDCS